jgi:flavin-dependent thymidylate synthase
MPPIVRLAGFNVDGDLLRETVEFLQTFDREGGTSLSENMHSGEANLRFEQLAHHVRTALNPDSFTPETISAAYARVSRDPKHVSELRRSSRFSVARARKSNENIIFGLGHASVAEHACFNFDISNLSRLACEELQSHRLASFTEKSQRYVTLIADFIIPPELSGSRWEDKFRKLMPGLFAEYENLCARLATYHAHVSAAECTTNEDRERENRSKEDARYLLPLACATQMGMTVNARNLEYVIRDFSDHPLQEVRELGIALSAAVSGLAPSLVKYTQRGRYPRANRQDISTVFSVNENIVSDEYASAPTVQLVESTPHPEETILRALAFSAGIGFHAPQDYDKTDIWRRLYRAMTVHDNAPREFETATLTFAAQVSASCFAQLKRHRMLTLLSRPYNGADGFILPPAIREAGLESAFLRTIGNVSASAAELAQENFLLAAYLLTNAHRRHVLIHMNARELFHFTRLRSDRHAQWEIRRLSDQMLNLARAVMPNVCALACGKDQFEEAYRAMYSD